MHALLERYIPIAKAVAETFGSSCEVVIFDTQDVNHSIVHIENGHVTGREVGAPMSDIISYLYQSSLFTNTNLITNYLTYTSSGKKMKATIHFIRDEKNKTIGFFSINYLLDKLLMIRDDISDFCDAKEQITDEQPSYQAENSFRQTIEEVFTKLFKESIQRSGKSIEVMKKADKVELVRYLYKRGVFMISGSVEEVAKRLNISRYTVYNYLSEVKQEKKIIS